MHGTLPSITVEVPAQGKRLSLHRYGSASEVHRCCRNASSRFFTGVRLLHQQHTIVTAFGWLRVLRD
jgi:hypothetical protein